MPLLLRGVTTALLLFSCGDELIDPSQPGLDMCEVNVISEAWSGQWSISGTARRSGCRNEQLDVDQISFHTPVAMPISEQQGTLSLDDLTSPGALSVDGTVHGNCVNFMLSEVTSEGLIVYHFEGQRADATHVYGTLVGSGPFAGCHLEGDYALTIVP